MKKISDKNIRDLNKCGFIYEIHNDDIDKLAFVLEELAIYINSKSKKKEKIGILLINCNEFRVGTPLFVFFSSLMKKLNNLEIVLITA